MIDEKYKQIIKNGSILWQSSQLNDKEDEKEKNSSVSKITGELDFLKNVLKRK